MNESPPPPKSTKRAAPPRVDAVVAAGISYEQVRNALDLGYDQLTGYARAVDLNTGDTIWVSRIYTVEIDESKERDVQHVYFTDMTLSEDGKSLLITNERGARFSVDTETGQSTALEGD